ncbi:hypothetical protein LIER_15094 [Lithospermum erythrorhizon]|uniref:Zinc finger, CCHC-type n=1 Tax=Lithospermum erythrorhizon TaxID=34254 RepID=A0AAV3Q4Q5_LITER
MHFLLTSLKEAYNVESAKLLWDQLEARYMREDTTSKKFLVSHFNGYFMVDSRFVLEQFHELERILGNDHYSVNTIMESRDAVFDENCFTMIPRPRNLIVDTRMSNDGNVQYQHGSSRGETSQVRRSKRVRTSKDFGIDFFWFLGEGGRETESVNSYIPNCYNLDYGHVTFEEPMRSPDAPF